MFKIGQSYFVEAEDWNFIKPNKSPEQRMGFAIDNAVKRPVKAEGHTPSTDQFGPWDWHMADGTYVDTKSFLRKSVTLSEGELKFIKKLNTEGGKMLHALFKQNSAQVFSFVGYVDIIKLVNDHKIHGSHFNDGYFYYTADLKDYLFEI